jgi:hypothetical protein
VSAKESPDNLYCPAFVLNPVSVYWRREVSETEIVEVVGRTLVVE